MNRKLYKYVLVRKAPGAKQYHIHLRVDNQTFLLQFRGSKKACLWMRRMLVIALSNILVNEK